MDISDYRSEVMQNLSFAWSEARKRIQIVQAKQKCAYDRNASGEVPFKVGERVWIFMPAIGVGRSKKFTRRWQGPYRILIVNLPNVQVRLCEKPNSEPFWVHVNRLKGFFETESTLLSMESQIQEDNRGDKSKKVSSQIPSQKTDKSKKVLSQIPMQTRTDRYNLRSKSKMK